MKNGENAFACWGSAAVGQETWAERNGMSLRLGLVFQDLQVEEQDPIQGYCRVRHLLRARLLWKGVAALGDLGCAVYPQTTVHDPC